MKAEITIAQIPYLNCIPFFWNKNIEIPEVKIQWMAAHPKEMGRLAAEGQMDAGPLSLLDTAALAENFEPLPFGISAKDEARSVLLFSKFPIHELGGKVIGLTPQSATSTEALKHLLRDHYRLSPQYQFGFSDQDSARLLIGNQALFALLDAPTLETWPHRMDLGQAWKKWKGHSFVFARWMVRRNLPEYIKLELEDWLSESLKGYEADPTRAIRQFEAAEGWKMDGTEAYLASFDFRPRASDVAASLSALTRVPEPLLASGVASDNS